MKKSDLLPKPGGAITKAEYDEGLQPYNQQKKFYRMLVGISDKATRIIEESKCYEGRLIRYAEHIVIDDPFEKHHLTWFCNGIDEGLPVDVEHALHVLNRVHEVWDAISSNDPYRIANASIHLGVTSTNAFHSEKLSFSGENANKKRKTDYERLFHDYKEIYISNCIGMKNEVAANWFDDKGYKLVKHSTLVNVWIPKYRKGEEY